MIVCNCIKNVFKFHMGKLRHLAGSYPAFVLVPSVSVIRSLVAYIPRDIQYDIEQFQDTACLNRLRHRHKNKPALTNIDMLTSVTTDWGRNKA
jgi:hypothetical protein